MSTLFERLQSLFGAAPSRPPFEVSYLGHAVDIYDLERRMRSLDTRDPWASLTLALASRQL